MKSVLLENGGLLTRTTDVWAKSISENYTLVNTETRDYMKHNDLFAFAMFIDPELTDVITSSSFPTIMSFEAHRLNGRDYLTNKWTQLEYMSWLIYEAVGWRKRRGLQTLNIHVNYEAPSDFLDDVNKEELGEEVKMYLKLMMRQSEGSVILKIYKNGELKETVTNEDGLMFTR